MKTNRFVLTALAAGGLLFCAACNKDYTDKENTHPLFAKGIALKSSQNYSKAKEAFEGFLAFCPKSARAHRELAELYSDYLGDYVSAVYHYERYLEYDGKLSDIDRKDIRKLIEGCKRKFYERYQQENGLAPMTQDASSEGDPQRVRQLENDLISARQFQAAVAEKYRTLMAEKKRLEAELKAASAASRSTAEKKRDKNVAGGSIPPVRVPPTPPAAARDDASSYQTYQVQSGETLSMIARKFFGKSSAWKKIRDANPGVIGPDGVVRSGQVIRIPAAEK